MAKKKVSASYKAALKASVLNLTPKMEAYIDKKLEKNGMAQEAIKAKDFRTVMVEAAKACVGIKEKTGRNDGEFIREIQDTYGGASGEAYCAAGMMTLLAYASKKTGIPHKVYETELAQNIWKKTDKAQRVKYIPLPGAIAVWGDVGKSTGHTELVIAADEKVMHCVGFNTSGTTNPNSTVNREGNGVYYTIRSYKSTSKRAFLGCVKPI